MQQAYALDADGIGLLRTLLAQWQSTEQLHSYTAKKSDYAPSVWLGKASEDIAAGTSDGHNANVGTFKIQRFKWQSPTSYEDDATSGDSGDTWAATVEAKDWFQRGCKENDLAFLFYLRQEDKEDGSYATNDGWYFIVLKQTASWVEFDLPSTLGTGDASISITTLTEWENDGADPTNAGGNSITVENNFSFSGASGKHCGAIRKSNTVYSLWQVGC